jgi:hypothetical protein
MTAWSWRFEGAIGSSLAGHKILMAMDCTIADVVFKSDLSQHLCLLAGKSFANARIAGQILSGSLSDALNSFPFR